MTTDYIEEEEFRDFVKDGSTLDAAAIKASITTASRSIDQTCKRRFWLDDTPRDVLFTTNSIWALEFVDGDGQQWDLATTDGLAVAVDLSGTGTYSTTLTLNTHFMLSPVNQSRYGQPWPYTSLQVLSNGGGTLPLSYPGYPETVKITGTWGWPTVPDAVRFATKLAANRYFGRGSTRYGTAGFDASGYAMRIRQDPDIMALLEPFMDHSAMIA
jgi:hypothetical protein